MKKTLSILGLFFFSLSAMAADEWKSYFKNNEVEILYQYANCHDEVNGIHQQKVLFKYVNLSNHAVVISFNKQSSFTDTPASSKPENNCAVTLQANQTVEGRCTDKDKAFFIFSRHLNMQGRKLIAFDLKNITVKTIQ
ncbi:MAG: hypothetical protein U0T74_14550 [Chitinophagales bacterium]